MRDLSQDGCKSAITATKTQQTIVLTKQSYFSKQKELYSEKTDYDENDRNNNIVHIKSAITATKTQKPFFLKKELYSEKADYDENDEKIQFHTSNPQSLRPKPKKLF